MTLPDLGLDPIRLASLTPGSVAHVVRFDTSLDHATVADLRRRGLLVGIRVTVDAVTHDGGCCVRAARGGIAVRPGVARSILVVPGDLAAISDEVARGGR